jgi:hypothetical protein
MKIKQKILFLVLAVGAMTTLTLAPSAVNAKCGGVDTSIINCSQTGGVKKDSQDSPIWGVLVLILKIMTGGVGILAVGGIVYGSILYASAGDKAEQTKKAISVITNVVVGLAAYGLMYVILNFLIPGGIFT